MYRLLYGIPRRNESPGRLAAATIRPNRSWSSLSACAVRPLRTTTVVRLLTGSIPASTSIPAVALRNRHSPLSSVTSHAECVDFCRTSYRHGFVPHQPAAAGIPCAMAPSACAVQAACARQPRFTQTAVGHSRHARKPHASPVPPVNAFCRKRKGKRHLNVTRLSPSPKIPSAPVHARHSTDLAAFKGIRIDFNGMPYSYLGSVPG